MVGAARSARRRHSSLKPLAGHGGGAIQQVADRVGQIIVHQIAEALLLEITVFTEGNIPQEIPPHRIRAAALQQDLWIEHITQGLAHLLALAGKKTMAEHLDGQG